MTKTLTFRDKLRINKNAMYAKYLKAIEEEPTRNKSQLKRELAAEFGYTSENSVNTIIWEIEKNNNKKATR